METLTAEQLLAAKDFVEEHVDVPEWGGCVKVRTLSMGARYRIAEGSATLKGREQRVDSVRLAVLTLLHGIVDPKLTEEQAILLAEKNASAVERVIQAIWRASALDTETAKNESPRA